MFVRASVMKPQIFYSKGLKELAALKMILHILLKGRADSQAATDGEK